MRSEGKNGGGVRAKRTATVVGRIDLEKLAEATLL